MWSCSRSGVLHFDVKRLFFRGGGVSEGNHRVDDTRVEIGSAFFADFVTGGVYIFGGN